MILDEFHVGFPITGTVCTRLAGCTGIAGLCRTYTFSVCGHLTAWKRNRLCKKLANGAFLKVLWLTLFTCRTLDYVHRQLKLELKNNNWNNIETSAVRLLHTLPTGLRTYPRRSTYDCGLLVSTPSLRPRFSAVLQAIDDAVMPATYCSVYVKTIGKDKSTISRQWWIQKFWRGGGGGRQCISRFVIYRKCTWWTNTRSIQE